MEFNCFNPKMTNKEIIEALRCTVIITSIGILICYLFSWFFDSRYLENSDLRRPVSRFNRTADTAINSQLSEEEIQDLNRKALIDLLYSNEPPEAYKKTRNPIMCNKAVQTINCEDVEKARQYKEKRIRMHKQTIEMNKAEYIAKKQEIVENTSSSPENTDICEITKSSSYTTKTMSLVTEGVLYKIPRFLWNVPKYLYNIPAQLAFWEKEKLYIENPNVSQHQIVSKSPQYSRANDSHIDNPIMPELSQSENLFSDTPIQRNNRGVKNLINYIYWIFKHLRELMRSCPNVDTEDKSCIQTGLFFEDSQQRAKNTNTPKTLAETSQLIEKKDISGDLKEPQSFIGKISTYLYEWGNTIGNSQKYKTIRKFIPDTQHNNVEN